MTPGLEAAINELATIFALTYASGLIFSLFVVFARRAGGR